MPPNQDMMETLKLLPGIGRQKSLRTVRDPSDRDLSG